MRKIAFIGLIFTIFSLYRIVFALSVETHRTINIGIAVSMLNGFSLDQYLISNLGILNGIQEKYNGSQIDEWLGIDGKSEDWPPNTMRYWRSRNHFHNPLKPLDQAGYSYLGGKSAIAKTDNIGHHFQAEKNRFAVVRIRQVGGERRNLHAAE